MIDYEERKFNLLFFFGRRGSVLPKAVCHALPSAALAVLCRQLIERYGLELESTFSELQVWTTYNFVLGFLIVFRTQQAYSRYWEGATLLQQIRGEWRNAVSSLFAFCTNDEKKRADVLSFQHHLVRLMSMLHCCTLQKIAVMEDENFEIIDLDGMEIESLKHLSHYAEQGEIVLQWVQRLIVDSMRSGIVDVPPPILSRAFQELSRGIVNACNARKIADTLFPFPYAQMIAWLLIVHSLLTPVICSVLQKTWWGAGTLAGMAVLVFWSVNFVAIEIEMPFGDDPNDIPIAEMQKEMNKSLCALLERRTEVPPQFTLKAEALLCTRVQWDTTPLRSRRKSQRGRGSVVSTSTGTGSAATYNSEMRKLTSRAELRSGSQIFTAGKTWSKWNSPHERRATQHLKTLMLEQEALESLDECGRSSSGSYCLVGTLSSSARGSPAPGSPRRGHTAVLPAPAVEPSRGSLPGDVQHAAEELASAQAQAVLLARGTAPTGAAATGSAAPPPPPPLAGGGGGRRATPPEGGQETGAGAEPHAFSGASASASGSKVAHSSSTGTDAEASNGRAPGQGMGPPASITDKQPQTKVGAPPAAGGAEQRGPAAAGSAEEKAAPPLSRICLERIRENTKGRGQGVLLE